MKKLILEYTLIPMAIKSYMIIGATLYKAKMLKSKIAGALSPGHQGNISKLAQA